MNWDLDIIDVGFTPFQYFKPVAHLFQQTMFERNFQHDWFFHFEAHEIADALKNLKEIYVVCEEPIDWLYLFDGSYYWPCGNENMYFVDKSSGQVSRGDEGIDKIIRLHNLKLPREASVLRNMGQTVTLYQYGLEEMRI